MQGVYATVTSHAQLFPSSALIGRYSQGTRDVAVERVYVGWVPRLFSTGDFPPFQWRFGHIFRVSALVSGVMCCARGTGVGGQAALDPSAA